MPQTVSGLAFCVLRDNASALRERLTAQNAKRKT